MITAMVTVLVACGGQPEDDLDPEDVFPPNMTVSDAAVSEGGDLIFTLNIDYTQGLDVSVDYSVVDVSTTDGVDYPSTSGTVVIPASADILTATVTIATIQDALDEADEQFSLELSNPVEATIVDGTAIGTIIDDDPLPALSIFNVSISEGETATVQVSLSSVSGRDVSVDYSTSDGSALAGSDYQSTSGSLLIPAGSLSGSIEIVSVNDGIPEASLENLSVNLSNPSNASAGVVSAQVEIEDDDAGALPFAYINDVNALEFNDWVFTVTFNFPTPSLSSFDYQSFDGSATQAQDYSAVSGTANIGIGVSSVSITVTGLNDNVFEGTETFTLSLSNWVHLNAGDDLGVGTVNDDEVMPDLVVYDSSVTEGGTLVFDVSLSGLTTEEVTYNFATTFGTASSGLDYAAITGSGTIAALSLLSQHPVLTVDDSIDEDVETLALDLSSVVGANLLDNSGLGSIGDNDAPPVLNISDVSEFEGATLRFIASLSALSSKNVTFVWQTYDETAESGVDFMGGSSLTTIPAGSSSVIIAIPSIQELIDEPDETFAISLGSLINAQTGVLGAQGIIQNEDVPPNFQVMDSLVDEGDVAFVLVTLSHQSISDIVFDYTTVDGSATAVGDYIAVAANITIPSGNLFHIISISTVEDLLDETGEVFSVSVTSLVGATPIDLNGTVAVTDDDARIDIFDALGTEGETALFVVSLSKVLAEDLTFSYLSGSLSATDGVDYGSLSGLGTVPAGSLQVTLSSILTDDTIYESTENFEVSLFGLSANAEAGDLFAEGSISDNDTVPEIHLVDVVTLEGSNLEFIVTLSKVPALEVTFDYATADNSATAGSDYAAVSGSATFDVGVLQITLAISGQEDAVDEGVETFNLNVFNAGNATIVDGTGVATIEDNESTLYVYDAAASEGETILFKASLSRALVIDSSFSYNTVLNGDAIVTDITPVAATTVTFGAGLTELNVPVITTEDVIFETNETFGITVAALNQLLAGSSAAVGTINNDDAVPTIDVFDVAVAEGGSAQVKVSLTSLTSEDVFFSYATSDNSATGGGVDYNTASGVSSIPAGSYVRFIYVQTIDDLLFEGDEVFDFSISAITNANPGVVLGAVTVQDNEPLPKLYATQVSASEGDTATVVITLDYAHSQATSFNYNTTGISATDGVDFVDTSGSISLAPGQMTIQLGIPFNTDAVYEFDETISFDLAGLVSLSPGQLHTTLTILEASSPPDLYVYGDAQLESLQGVAVVSLSGNSTERPVTFDYNTIDGTANAATDFAGVSGTATISAGQQVFGVTVVFNPDTNFEADEYFVVTMTNVNGANSLVEFGVISIINDDPAPSIFIDDVNLSENAGTMNFLVSLDEAGTSDATFAFVSSANTATEGVDYIGVSGVGTIPMGSLTTWVHVAISDDGVDEATEYFDVILSSLSNVNVGDIVGAGAISDDDPAPFVSIDDAVALEGSTLSFTVSLSLASEQEIVFSYDTYDTGSAVAGVDDNAPSGAVTFAAGVSVTTVDVAVLTDVSFEATESFNVSLSGLSNVQSGDIVATGSITDNNTPPLLFALDAVVNEGETVTLQVTLSEASGADAVFSWSTMDNTALSGADYTGDSGTATVLAGNLSTSVQVVTQNDAIYQGNLLFHVSLSAATNASLGDDFGNVSIIDGETAPISYFIVEGITDPTTVGVAETVTVTAYDTLGEVKSDYFGTITFSSSDGTSSLPVNYTFTVPDAGQAVFASGVTFNSIGTYYVRAEEVGTPAVFGQQSNIDVSNPAAPCNVSTVGFQVSSSSGSETSTSVDLVVALSETCATEITLSYNTYDGSALAGSDYTAASGVLTIPSGNSSENINISVINDAAVDASSETFQVSLSNAGPANVVLGTALHTYTIFDDEGTPPCNSSTVGFIDSSGSGDESVADASYTVSLSQSCTSDVTVNYSFADLSATNGSDYSGTNGVLTIPSGSLTASVPVTVMNDTLSETPESFRVNLYNAGPNDVSVGLSVRDYTINDDDGGPPPCSTTIGFTQQNGTALESVTIVNLELTSSNACSGYEITVDYSTANLSATSGSDYVYASGTATFPVNVTTITIPIVVTDDAAAESTESFQVEISNPQPAGAIILGNSVYTHSILDNDGAGTIYYVRASGSDASAGTSAGTAWQTLGHAIANVVAGDTIFVGSGVYNESLTLGVAGASGSTIQWIGDITGSNTGDPGPVSLTDSGSNRVLNVNNKGYNTFDSFIFAGATGGEGIYSGTGAPAGIIFKNCTMTGNSIGVSLRNAGAMVFENNIVSSNSTAAVQLDQGSSDTIFRNNLIINNSGKGLQLVKNNANVTVINNTFNNNTGNQIEVGQNGSAIITNNIITNGGAGGIAKVSSGTATIDHNDVWNNNSGTSNYTGGFAAGTNDISSDPLFVGGGSYRVETSSPTLDSGSANASTITFSDGSSMGDRSTRSDGASDGNTFGGDGLIVNMGFHY